VTARLSYTYWSYEEYGRCYIGVRQCKPEYPTPESDIHYLGSSTDKTFKPTHKIILNVFDNYEDARNDEIELHKAFDVARNPNFANRAKSTSTKFSFDGSKHTEVTKQKISEGNKGKTVSYGSKQKISEAKKGKILSDEHKRKLSEAKTGENHPMHGKSSPCRNTEAWDRYDWIKDLHIRTGWGCNNICKAYNQEFGTNHGTKPFRNILKKIKEEIITNVNYGSISIKIPSLYRNL
jgi:hypothetical protein